MDLNKPIPDQTLLDTSIKVRTDPNPTQHGLLHHRAFSTKFPLPGHCRDLAPLARDSAGTCPTRRADMLRLRYTKH